MPEVTASHDGLRLHLTDDETRLIRGLADEMRILLEADVPSADPVMARLFPKAYEEPERQDGYARLTGDDLHSAKLNALRTVLESLDVSRGEDIALADDSLNAWLCWLTDVRLAIGTRLDVDEDKMGTEVDPSDPEAPALSVLHWLGLIQGLILEGLEDNT